MQKFFQMLQKQLSLAIHSKVKGYEVLRRLEKGYSESVHELLMTIKTSFKKIQRVCLLFWKKEVFSKFYPQYYYLPFLPMQQFEDSVSVDPENILTFYRNQYQSAATITIVRHPQCKSTIKYCLKTTHKDAFLVSSGKGEMKQDQQVKYIDVLINQEFPLEQCLMDRFKLLLLVPGKQPLQKRFKVAINYKKDTSNLKQKDFNGLQIASRTTGSQSTVASSTLGHPLTSVRKSLLKHSKLSNYLTKGEETENVNLQEQLDDLVKVIQERRFRLQYLSQEILKNRSRKKFGCYITLLAIAASFFMGLAFRQVADVDLQQLLQSYGL